MSVDFPGHAQVDAVMTRLRSELKKTVLVAASPRVFDGDWLPTSGGYGLTLPDDIPEHWESSPRNVGGAIDQLCPILEGWRWGSLQDGTDIEDGHLAATGFTAAEIYGVTDDATNDNWRGSGYMLVEQESIGDSGENGFYGKSQVEYCLIKVTIRVPAGFGQGQAQLYAGLLAKVLGERTRVAGIKANNVIGLGDDDTYLRFGWAPEMGRIEEESGEFLGLVWEAEAVRHYLIP